MYELLYRTSVTDGTGLPAPTSSLKFKGKSGRYSAVEIFLKSIATATGIDWTFWFRTTALASDTDGWIYDSDTDLVLTATKALSASGTGGVVVLPDPPGEEFTLQLGAPAGGGTVYCEVRGRVK